MGRNFESVVIEFYHAPALSKNKIRALNWRTTSTLSKEQRKDAYMLSLEAMSNLKGPWLTPERAEVTITQYHAGAPLDYEGLACVAAPSVDGMVDAGVLMDDDPKHVVEYNLRHVKVKKMSENKVTIGVTPAGERMRSEHG